MKILVLGATGMLGSTLVRYLSRNTDLHVMASAREPAVRVADVLKVSVDRVLGGASFSGDSLCALSAMTAFSGVNNSDSIDSSTHQFLRAVVDFEPDVVINAIGVIKQNEGSKDALLSVPLNTLLPHFLARVCKELGARLIHVSTDCVFSGAKGRYTESDRSDATDLYGRSKYMGEVHHQRHVFTLRTSIIGHELWRQSSLLEWFLSQEGPVLGYRHAVFSGLPTVELARVIDQFVLPRPDLHGLYHISSDPIDKHTLLRLIAEQYGKPVAMLPADEPAMDRSLDSSKFRQATGFTPESWPEQIRRMREFG